MALCRRSVKLLLLKPFSVVLNGVSQLNEAGELMNINVIQHPELKTSETIVENLDEVLAITKNFEIG